MSEAAQRFLLTGLLLWVVGALSFEAVASVGMVMVVGGVLSDLWLRRGIRNLGGWGGWTWLAGFGVWAVAAPGLAGRAPTGTGLGRLLEVLVIPFASHAWRALSAPRRRTVILVGASVFVLSCAVAGLQHFGVWPEESAFASLTWTKVAFWRVYEPVPGAEGRFMAGGLAFHRLRFAHVGALVVLGALAQALKGPGEHRAAAWSVAVLGATAVVYFPYARMAAAALGVGAVVLLVAGARNWRRGVALAAGLVLLAAGVMAAHPPLRQRFLSALTSRGNGDRAHLVGCGLRAVAAHPIAGTGAGNFRPAKFADAHTPAPVLAHTGKSHNQFVSIAAEAGLPGLALFLAALVVLGRRLPRRHPEGLAALGGLAVFLVLSLAHDPLFHPQFTMAWALLLGIGVSSTLPAPVPATTSPHPASL